MHASLQTAGERVDIECAPQWLADVIDDGASGALGGASPDAATVVLDVEAARHDFRVGGWEPLMRGAWRQGRDVLIENACSSGLDLLVRPTDTNVTIVVRWRPPARVRAATAMRSRFHLLLRAVLLQYPAMWWAGTRGRVPLHASVLTAGTATPLIAGPSGVGKSTLLESELAEGGAAISDNLSVTDGASAWGVVEPMRVDGGAGRRMPHGRRERPMINRVASLVPDRVVLLRRGTATRAEIEPCDPSVAARALIGSTYMAGELRRYWPFAATLAAGTGLGPAHPAICQVSEAMTRRVPCMQVSLSTQRDTRLVDVLHAEVPQGNGVPFVGSRFSRQSLTGAPPTPEPSR